jgi:hypothetical protein
LDDTETYSAACLMPARFAWVFFDKPAALMERCAGFEILG